MSDNLTLWRQVEKTDPAHVKAITGKSYKGTSPKPHWIVMKATETFGPIGIGWGFTVDERVEKGALIADGFYEQMHIAKVKVWYKWNGERGEVEHIGGTTFSGKYASGKIFTDEDAPKKSVTDALVKALSMIGFAGDIFMGRFDDSKYVQEVGQEFADEKKKADAPKPISAAEQKRQLEAIESDLLDCHSIPEVDKCAKIWGAIIKRDEWSKDYRDLAAAKFPARRAALTAAAEPFPGDLPPVGQNSYVDNMRAG
jgi:hypothetical protein